MKLGINFEKVKVDASEHYNEAVKIYEELKKDKEDFTGWVNRPFEIEPSELDEMEKVAGKIRELCEVLIVIGIGGSYLGAAALDRAVCKRKEGCPELVFAGTNLSGEELAKVLNIMKTKETCLCVVSKSGNTLETKLTYKVLKQALTDKYGGAAKERIVAITDATSGSLRAEVDEAGYANFEIPRNIGGRYSAFTPAILFPLMATGLDVRTFINGAKDIAEDDSFWRGDGLKYAMTRYYLGENGKEVEVFEYFEPSLDLVGEWAKQLFAESEGKEGKGLLPTTLTFSRDLHSLGQYLQEGKKNFFETIINIANADTDVIIPEGLDETLSGKSLNDINHIALDGVVAAHSKAGTPIIRIDLEKKDEYCLGQLLYFFMMTAAVTGKLMKIDPFIQEGVEQYKSEIRNIMAANKEK